MCINKCKNYNKHSPLFQLYRPTVKCHIKHICRRWTNIKKQVVNPRHQTPQGQSLAKPGTPVGNILSGNIHSTHRSSVVPRTIQYSKWSSSTETSQWECVMAEPEYWSTHKKLAVVFIFSYTHILPKFPNYFEVSNISFFFYYILCTANSHRRSLNSFQPLGPMYSVQPKVSPIYCDGLHSKFMRHICGYVFITTMSDTCGIGGLSCI